MTNPGSEPLTFMAVHAHPDDEVFDTGGTLARLAAEGIRTVLVTATLGEAGEVVDSGLDQVARKELYQKLHEVRLEELKASAEILHVNEVHILGYRDSGIAGSEHNKHPASFCRAPLDEAVKRLVALIRQSKPQVIATYDRKGGYGHPDHIQVHRITLIAFEAAGDPRLYPELGLDAWQPEKLYYMAIPRSILQRAALEMERLGIDGPWNVPHLGTDEELITTRIDVRDYVEDKLNAFRAHKTQIVPSAYMFTLPEEKRNDMLGYEWYILARSTLPTFQLTGLEQDLFTDVYR